MSTEQITKTATVPKKFKKAVKKVKAALKEQGFGILTEIDVQATLKTKLDVDYPPTLILGACNPKLAHRALLANADVSVLMPCNVVVRVNEDGKVEVAAMDPMILSELMKNPEITLVAEEGAARLDKALAQIVG
ncbi:MAG: DUF302 domain-containing protein [Magnetococcales bacterium]|nr:DUF302 domain-containing protein [Magnetococcales bacterium]